MTDRVVLSPEKIINFTLEIQHNYKPDWGREIVEALDAAGWEIKRKGKP